MPDIFHLNRRNHSFDKNASEKNTFLWASAANPDLAALLVAMVCVFVLFVRGCADVRVEDSCRTGCWCWRLAAGCTPQVGLSLPCAFALDSSATSDSPLSLSACALRRPPETGPRDAAETRRQAGKSSHRRWIIPCKENQHSRASERANLLAVCGELRTLIKSHLSECAFSVLTTLLEI
jgi:hypothetical protein